MPFLLMKFFHGNLQRYHPTLRILLQHLTPLKILQPMLFSPYVFLLPADALFAYEVLSGRSPTTPLYPSDAAPHSNSSSPKPHACTPFHCLQRFFLCLGASCRATNLYFTILTRGAHGYLAIEARDLDFASVVATLDLDFVSVRYWNLDFTSVQSWIDQAPLFLSIAIKRLRHDFWLCI